MVNNYSTYLKVCCFLFCFLLSSKVIFFIVNIRSTSIFCAMHSWSAITTKKHSACIFPRRWFPEIIVCVFMRKKFYINNTLKLLLNDGWTKLSKTFKQKVKLFSLYSKLSILKIEDLNNFETLKFMYEFKNKTLQIPFRNYFTPASNFYNYERRNLEKAISYLSNVNRKLTQISIKICGIKWWNKLSTRLLNYTNKRLSVFSKKIKIALHETFKINNLVSFLCFVTSIFNNYAKKIAFV